MYRLTLLHRIVSVLSSALLLQLSLLSTGTLCRMHGDQAMSVGMSAPTGRTSHPSHAGMHAAHASNVATMSEASPGMPSGPCDANGMSKSCDSPWAPTGCVSTTTCVTAVSALASSSWSGSEQGSGAVQVVSSADMPLGPTFAPELPPPRA
jgi:hypothetical protein